MPISEVKTSLRSASARKAQRAPRPRSGPVGGPAGPSCGSRAAPRRRSARRATSKPSARSMAGLLAGSGPMWRSANAWLSCSTSSVPPRHLSAMDGTRAAAVPPLSRDLRDSPDLRSGRRVDRLSPSVRPAPGSAGPALQSCLARTVRGPERFRGGCSFGAPLPGTLPSEVVSCSRNCTRARTPSVLDERRLHDLCRDARPPHLDGHLGAVLDARAGGTPSAIARSSVGEKFPLVTSPIVSASRVTA